MDQIALSPDSVDVRDLRRAPSVMSSSVAGTSFRRNLAVVVATAVIAAASGWLASIRILGQKSLEILARRVIVFPA